MKVKKIAALALGAAMVGATVGLASAQPTVPEIPKDFFVKDGQPNVKIVVGSQGAALDVASAADIAVALGTMLYTTEEVELKDASVVVKEDVADDPDDIPVFDNTYTGSYKDGENLKTQQYWWNGSFDEDDDPYYNAAFDSSAWAGGVFDDGWDVTVEDAVEWKDGNGDNYWKDPTGKKHYADDVELHYDITIGKVALKDINEDTINDIDEFNDFTLVVDNVVANVTFTINAYEKTLWDPVLGATGTTYTVSDLTPSHYSLHQEGVIKGVEQNDTITLFGKTIEVLDIGVKDGKPYIKYGKDWEDTYIDADASKTFGDYTVKVLDIDTEREKALFEVSGPEGSETFTLDLNTHKYEVLFDGGIMVTLLDTFVGIGGTNTVKVDVKTDIDYLYEGDEFIPGWTVSLGVNETEKTLEWFALTNKEELEGKEVKLFDTYVMDYQADIMKEKDNNDVTYAAMEAWVVIDPIEAEWEYTTYEKGDEIGNTGYIVDDIKATADPAEAAVVSKITTPITVLDTELMEAGLDSVDSNLILVGGPVVNSVTAALAETLGVPADYEGWANEFGTGADSGVVKYVAEVEDINGYGVVLVAGSDREGTAAAAEALMKYLAGLN